MIKNIETQLPELFTALSTTAGINYTDNMWETLQHLLSALAPSGGPDLPGGIGDTIADKLSKLSNDVRIFRNFEGTGNLAVRVGADKPQADIILIAHMDRPTYRIRSLENRLLYPICANRFPKGEYRVPAQAVRFENGKLQTSATGHIKSTRDGNPSNDQIEFEIESGDLHWHDSVLLNAIPKQNGNLVIGSGLDNCLGVTILMGIIGIYSQLIPLLENANRTCLFIFTDQEEAPPDAFFGHGASRLRFATPPPTMGIINVDAHNTGEEHMPRIGKGVSHCFLSGDGRGSLVPLQFQTLGIDLAKAINTINPETVQLNYAYLSRSDDVVLSRWSRILALAGPPMANAHTGEETANLGDVQKAIRWICIFLAVSLGLIPRIDNEYALYR